MIPTNFKTVLFAATALSLAACSTAERTGTYAEIRQLDGGGILLNTSDLRTVSRTQAAERSSNGQIQPKFISCVEPSADVAKVIGDSLSLSGALSVKGLPSGIEPNVAAAISRATAASMAQLGERLATIQLLRDGLFRACEAYANGALSDISYAVLLSRYDDTMVTLLSGELAAGAFGRSLATLSSEAGGSGRASLDVAEKREHTREAERELNTTRSEQRDLEQKLDAKQSELRESDKSLNEKRAELSEIESSLKKARAQEGVLERAATSADAAGKAATLKTDLEQARKEVKRLETERSQAEKSVAKAERETSQFRKEAEKLEATLHQKQKDVVRAFEELKTRLEAEVAANAKGSATAAGAITRLQDSNVAQVVADIQRKYIENVNSDALVVACLVVMSKASVQQGTDAQNQASALHQQCPGFMRDLMKTQTERLKAVKDESHVRAERILGQELQTAIETIKKAQVQLNGLNGLK